MAGRKSIDIKNNSEYVGVIYEFANLPQRGKPPIALFVCVCDLGESHDMIQHSRGQGKCLGVLL